MHRDGTSPALTGVERTSSHLTMLGVISFAWGGSNAYLYFRRLFFFLTNSPSPLPPPPNIFAFRVFSITLSITLDKISNSFFSLITIASNCFLFNLSGRSRQRGWPRKTVITGGIRVGREWRRRKVGGLTVKAVVLNMKTTVMFNLTTGKSIIYIICPHTELSSSFGAKFNIGLNTRPYLCILFIKCFLKKK